jgi:hypothetical protein
MQEKYRRAAWQPWLLIFSDPPRPESKDGKKSTEPVRFQTHIIQPASRGGSRQQLSSNKEWAASIGFQ